MVLHNVDIIHQGVRNIQIVGSEIAQIRAEHISTNNELNIYLDDCICFPGLINSHDHLDFNLFPQLGNNVYKDYVEWGNDIHQQNKAVIDAILKIPKPIRTQWGVYKNLLNGITTVIQHGEKLAVNNSPINIFNQCHSLHSVRLEKHWKAKLNNPFVKNWPFVVHIGEGTNIAAHEEINELIRWNLLKRKLIAIHGVAMDKKQAKQFKALIWSPDSNMFLLGKTAAINELKKDTKIIFGSDSTVSANWSIWEQLRLARSMKMLNDSELIQSVTSLAAEVWELNKIGVIQEKSNADLIVVKKEENGSDYFNSFFAAKQASILLVICNGKIVLFDESLMTQLKSIASTFNKCYVDNIGKYVIGNLPALIKEIQSFNGNVNFPITID